MLRVRHLFIILMAFLFFTNCSSIALANNTQRAAADEDVRVFLDSFLARTFSIVDSDRITRNLVERSEAVLTECVDYNWLGTFVMGNMFNLADADQKIRLIAAYKMNVVYTYLPLIIKYKKVNYQVKSIQNMDNNTFLVSVDLRCVNCNGRPINIIYRIRVNGGSYQIYDVVIEGVSFLVMQRNNFKNMVTNVKTVDDVIEKMERENHRMKSSIIGRS